MPVRRLLAPLALLAAAGCSGGSPAPGGPAATIAAEPAELTGSGATFIEPIMKFWTEEFLAKTDGKVRVNYTGGGSGQGVSQLVQKLTAFGCSDAPMNRKQLAEATAAGGPVVHVPLVIGAVVPMYNLDGVDKPLAFSGPLLADIFTGKVTKWNDPKLAELNPGVTLPDAAIQPVVRADPSGTTFIFTDFLAKVSEPFRATVGASTAPSWPVGIKQNKSDGVAGHIARTAGSIGYIELTYALDKKAKYGAVVNAAGKPVLADLDSITAAAAASLGAKPTAEPYSLHELTYNLTNAPGAGSYPIAGMSFGLIFKQQSGAKGRAVVQFLRWCASAEGQAMARKRNYAPLPAELQKQIAAALDAVTVSP